MSLYQFALNTQYVQEECANCQCRFALTLDMYNRRKEDGRTFHCPNGHGQHYAETTVQKLKKQLEEKDRKIASESEAKTWYSRRLDQQIKTSRAYKGQVTKIKNRVSNGVCPCCNRTFANLQRHMAHLHPEWKQES